MAESPSPPRETVTGIELTVSSSGSGGIERLAISGGLGTEVAFFKPFVVNDTERLLRKGSDSVEIVVDPALDGLEAWLGWTGSTVRPLPSLALLRWSCGRDTWSLSVLSWARLPGAGTVGYLPSPRSVTI